jgi:hypothetical protein
MKTQMTTRPPPAANLDEQTLRDIWSILHTANHGGQVQLEFNEHKSSYEDSPKAELERRAAFIFITDEERANCIALDTMWELTLRTVETNRHYVASSLSALVEIFREHETLVEKDATTDDLEKLKAYFEIPFLNTEICRDAHTAFSYTTCDDNVVHRDLSIKEYLEFYFGQGELDEEEKVQLEPVFQSDHLWEYHIYPRTPISFYKVAEPTLLELLSNLPNPPE